MRSKYVVLMLLVCFLGSSNLLFAASADDFEGVYDLAYQSALIDLDIVVTPPQHSSVTIPVQVEVALENEQVPFSEVSFIVDDVQQLLEEYGVPIQLESRILTALDSSLKFALDAINDKMGDLPDEMTLVKMLPKGNMVDGTFSDMDGGGRQFALPGMISPETGEVELSGLFSGVIDPELEFAGSGAFGTGDFDVSQEVKGVNVEIAGSAELSLDMSRM